MDCSFLFDEHDIDCFVCVCVAGTAAASGKRRTAAGVKYPYLTSEDIFYTEFLWVVKPVWKLCDYA